MQFITELRVEEPARFNPDRLEDLCRSVGETRAETEVARALERIGNRLMALDQTDPVHSRAGVCEIMADILQDAELIGMATLARVAHDVIACLDGRDPVALSATLARLKRIGDRSIHAVWELEDLSG